jgi:hypothetical protein
MNHKKTRDEIESVLIVTTAQTKAESTAQVHVGLYLSSWPLSPAKLCIPHHERKRGQ